MPDRMSDTLIKLARDGRTGKAPTPLREGVMMHIAALGLHLSDHCNARCEHCAYHCGPEAQGVMKLDEAKGYMEQAVMQGAELLCISGGEPLLFFDLTSRISKEAMRLRFRGIWVFTNAHWAVDRETANRKIALLKKAGVTRLCLGADGFHSQFIPGQRVSNALTGACEQGLEVVLDTRLMGKTLQEDNCVNKATIDILQLLGDLKNVETWRGQPLYVGRAADVLARKMLAEPGFLGGPCVGPWEGGSWTKPVGVDVDSYGEVTLCPGISIGNAKNCEISKILSGYTPSKHRIVRELSAGGPRSLMRVAQGMGYRPLASYLNACHLCYNVRKFIRSKYPSELAPRSCYEEIPLRKSA